MNQNQTEAVANADAHLSNAVLPTYTQLLATSREQGAAIAELLRCAELNQDDLEPETVKSIAAAWPLARAELPTYSQQQELIRALASALHPGAVGLIYAHHGDAAGIKAGAAVNAARAMLNAGGAA